MRLSRSGYAAVEIMLVAIVSVSRARAQSPAPADLIVTGARIYTVDPAHPMAEALAVRGTRLVFVGSAREALVFRGGGTRVVDVHGATIIPGLVDAHAHLLDLGQTLRQVDLSGAASYAEVVARVVARARGMPPGGWIQGWGWDQNRWPGQRFPTHDPLSAAVPDHPVLLARVDGHALLANARAMQLAGVTRETRDPDGGRVLRDTAGNPTGVFVDNAESLVARAVPILADAEREAAVLAAVAECNRWGLTGIHDPGVGRPTLAVYERLARTSRLTIRDYVMLSDDSAMEAEYFAKGPQSALDDGHLWIRAVKLYADGALGSRGAALLSPYSDDPGNIGLLVSTPEHLRDVSVRALKAGFQVATHAIGDRGNRMTLDAYDAALRAVPTADHRFRIEHAQIISWIDIPRFAELGVIPSMQAVHATSDMYWATERLGPTRILGAYAWRSLLNTGVVIPNGSDVPVERVNPLYSFHAAVTRQDEHDWPAGGWHPEQRMTRDEGLMSMTLWPAYAGFQEHDLGSLTAGKYADFVVLDRDIMTVADADILRTRVLATYLGGRAVYARPPEGSDSAVASPAHGS
jgi:predicted amidohydrolase YtcJ